MRLPAKLLLLGGGISAIIITGYLWRLPDQPAVQNPEVTNELCIIAPATPYDAASGLDVLAPKSIPADARCPVCGMYPARFPRWAAQTVFTDGASHFFDSPVDLIAFLQNIDRYSKPYTLKDIATSYVSDFENGQWIEAHDAFYVHGSNAVGPMRNADLPAFSSRKLADTFTRSRGGKVLAFQEVTPELVQTMSRNVHHRH